MTTHLSEESPAAPQLDDSEWQTHLEDALRRSREETNREESELADALAASLTTRDEEIARVMQREQLVLHEQSLHSKNRSIKTSSTLMISADSSPVSGLTTLKVPETLNETQYQQPGPSNPPYSRDQTVHVKPLPKGQGYGFRNTPRGHSVWCGGRGDSTSGCSTDKGLDPFWRVFPKASVGRTYGDVVAAAPSPSPPVRIEPVVESEEVQVVIDGQNVGCEFRRGDKAKFQARGVLVALEYYKQNGVKAVAILPRNKVDDRLCFRNGRPNTLRADDPALLLRLHEEGRVAFSPAGAHDDNFVLQYAMRKRADVISNDRYQKELELQETADDAWNLRTFLEDHLIPFTFVADEFVPNPRPYQLGRSHQQSRAKR